MAQNAPTVTYAPLTTGPSIDSRTITLWLQVQFSAGFYTVGGVPAGLAAYAATQTIDSVNFLAAYFSSEATTTTDGSSLPVAGGITYKYVPSTDKIQMFTAGNGLEFTASEAIPHAVLFDTIVLQAIYNRL